MLRSQEDTVASDSVDAEQLGEVRRAFNNLLRSFQQNEGELDTREATEGSIPPPPRPGQCVI